MLGYFLSVVAIALLAPQAHASCSCTCESTPYACNYDYIEQFWNHGTTANFKQFPYEDFIGTEWYAVGCTSTKGLTTDFTPTAIKHVCNQDGYEVYYYDECWKEYYYSSCLSEYSNSADSYYYYLYDDCYRNHAWYWSDDVLVSYACKNDGDTEGDVYLCIYVKLVTYRYPCTLAIIDRIYDYYYYLGVEYDTWIKFQYEELIECDYPYLKEKLFFEEIIYEEKEQDVFVYEEVIEYFIIEEECESDGGEEDYECDEDGESEEVDECDEDGESEEVDECDEDGESEEDDECDEDGESEEVECDDEDEETTECYD